jgi:hypothetical protein
VVYIVLVGYIVSKCDSEAARGKLNKVILFNSYRIGHVPAATWMTHPPCSWHPGRARIPSDSDNLTLLYQPSVDCGLYRIS